MIGERLKEIRTDYHDTQDMLALKLNVSIYTIQSWEQGKSDPSHDMLIRICKLYRVSSDFLLGLKDDDPVFISKREEQLLPENLKMLKKFQDFLLDEQKKES